MPYDVKNIYDVKVVLMLLSESVATRLREKGFYASQVQIDIKNFDLKSFSRQMPLEYSTNSAQIIFNTALKLFNENVEKGYAIRSLSVRASKLSKNVVEQIDLFGNNNKSLKERALESMSDNIRNRYGWASIQKGIMLTNRDLALINPTNDNSIQNIAFFKG